MMLNFRYNLLLLLILASLCACGFQLRGAQLEGLKQSKIYLKSSGASTLANELKEQLVFAEIPVVNTASEADYIIGLSNESFQRKVLSVSAQTGKVEEYELLYSALLSITDSNGKNLVSNESVSAQRDYAFDQTSVLGSFEQESGLRQDISKYAATSILRRLRAVTQ